ncbi:MAG: hypothetical protein RL410_16 [Actinomycetota bacterium]|jgi:hypothetical protein
MRLRLIAPLIVVLALAGCSKASDVTPTNSATPTSSSSAPVGTAAEGATADAIKAAATKFLQAAQIADWTAVCSVSVDKTGAAITGDAIAKCAANYEQKTNSKAAWAKLDAAKQKEITANAKTITFVGVATVNGNTAVTDKSWTFKGQTRTDGPSLTLVNVDGNWLVDSSILDQQTNPSTSASPIAS